MNLDIPGSVNVKIRTKKKKFKHSKTSLNTIKQIIFRKSPMGCHYGRKRFAKERVPIGAPMLWLGRDQCSLNDFQNVIRTCLSQDLTLVQFSRRSDQ